MSKNNVPYNQPIEESKDKPLFNIFTKSKVQKLLNEQLEFTQGLLKMKNQLPVSSRSLLLKIQMRKKHMEKVY